MALKNIYWKINLIYNKKVIIKHICNQLTDIKFHLPGILPTPTEQYKMALHNRKTISNELMKYGLNYNKIPYSEIHTDIENKIIDISLDDEQMKTIRNYKLNTLLK